MLVDLLTIAVNAST